MHASRIVALSAFSLALISTAASAEETAAPAHPARKDRVITLAPVVIPGRLQRPMVAVDVARLVPRAPLPALRKPLVDRIGAAVENDPF
jgi:hypothetical protein